LPAFEIQREILRNKRRQCVTRCVPPQCGTNARQQFFDAKGPDHIIVRSGIECEHFVPLRVSNREHDNRSIGRFPNLPARCDPTDTRHVHIEKYEVGLLLTYGFHCFLACLGLDDHVALAGESGTQYSPNLRLIVCDQD
jgi:hypothetical protein